MLNIEENQLKLLLEHKRKMLERKKYDGIGEIISSVSLMITLTLSDFSKITIIKPLFFSIVAWGISIVILTYGGYTFIKSIKIYSVDQLYDEIADLDPNIKHPFNIVVIRNNQENGDYLVYKSKRWKCWLFPDYHCLNDNFSEVKELKYINECIKRDLKISEEIEFKYLGNAPSHKFSVGDKVMKKYHFYYFEATNIAMNFNNKRTFCCNGKKFCWKTLDQMYSDRKIVKNNKDVLDYVRRMCDIS